MSENTISFNYGGQTLHLVKSDNMAALLLKSPDTHRPKDRSTKRAIDLPASEQYLGPFQLVKLPQLSTKTRSADSDEPDSLDKLRSLDEVVIGSHVFHLSESAENVPIVPSGKVYIEFMSDTGQDEQQALLQAYHLSIDRAIADNENAFIASVGANSPNPITTAIELQKSEKILVAEPDLIMPVKTNLLPSAKLFKEQWHLENKGNATLAYPANCFKAGADAKVVAAWQLMRSFGSSEVCIAVVDTGFDLEHPDLKGNGQKIKAPIDLETGSPNVYPSGNSNHGTACAGVALGAGTINGITGACPNATLVPIKMPYLSDTIIEQMANHILTNEVDIVSCSLGYPTPTPLSSYQQNILRRLVNEGRNKKGCPLFFAAGNSSRLISDFAADENVFAITASNSLDEFSTYSNYGTNTFLCAPSNGNSGAGVTTCDLVGSAGDAPRNYVPDFGGTSSATPLAAGICGLLLSVNPNLKVEDIRNLLQSTAEKIDVTGGYDHKGHSQYTGYGKINALKALQKLLQTTDLGSVTDENLPTPVEVLPTEVLKAVVIAHQLNVRQGPSTNHDVLSQLNKGDIVSILATVGVWCKIGEGRYINGKYLKILREAKSGMVTARRLNVRAEASSSGSILRTIKAREVVPILETANGWYRIGDFEWVSAQYIKVLK